MIGVGVLLWVIAALALINSWLAVLVIAVTLFVYRFHAGWLFFLGLCIDGYYGGFAGVPQYTLVFGGFALMVEVLKTRLIGVESSHE